MTSTTGATWASGVSGWAIAGLPFNLPLTSGVKMVAREWFPAKSIETMIVISASG